MLVRWVTGIYLVYLFIQITEAGKNSVIGVNTKCDDKSLNVTLLFAEEFRGLVFSKGFLRLCNSSGDSSDRAALRLSPPHCGVRITKAKDTGMLVMSAVIQVQMAASLQQVDDPSIPVTCTLQEEMFTLPTKKPLTSSRTGRGMGRVGKAWMEVRGSAISTLSPSQSLSVGEHTTLAIYTSLPDGVVGQPIECGVHDGHGTRQALSDSRGCPVEPSLVPRLRYDPQTGTWAAAFPAFSFPDYQLVHYTCLLRLCTHECPQVDCELDQNNTRNSRNYQEEEKNIMDVVELYNSVEVTAPNIELGYLKREVTEAVEEGLDSGGSVCLPAPRLALLLAGIGSVFLGAALTALCLLVRHKARSTASDRRLLVFRAQSPPLSLWSI